MKSKYIPIVLFTLLFVCPVLAQAEPAKAGQRQGRALSKTSQPGSEKDEEKQQGAITALAESGNPVEEMIQAEADAGGGTGFGMPMPLRPSALLGDAPNLEVFRKEKSQLLSFPDLQPPPQVPIVPTTALVDKTPPEIILSGLPAPLTKEKAANIAAQANEPTTYIYTLDGAVVTSPQLTNLSEGSHTFTVKATDPMGNSSSKAYSWITDYTPPGLTLSSTPAALTNANSASFIPAADEPSSYSYRLDGAAVTSPNLANLSEGSHTFTVTATDPAGNNSTKTYTWVTDYTAPTIALSSTPPAITNLKTAGIGVAANEQATYSYSFDGTVVDTPNFTNLPEGSHIFRVTATDPVGNSSTKTYSWVTDYTAPTIALSSTPASITNVKTAGIGVAANEPVTYGYSLDGMAVASPNLADLSEGSHTFTVTATDPAGNNSTRTYTWVTDYTAPAIELSAMPATLTSATTAGISATANEPATYSYRLDGTAVASPNLTNLPEGNHTFTVTATDPAGNSSTKTYEWFIGLRSYTLAGSTSGSLPGSVLSSSSGIRAISDKPSGSWLMEYGGNGSVADSSVLNFVAGGTVAGANGADEGYWLSRIGNADALSGNIAGSSNIISLSATKLGIGTGIISGTYSADAWRVTDSGLGGYSETPLALGAQIDAAYHYYDNIGETITSLGGFRGSLLGITASPFISAAALNVPGNPTSLYLMGQDVPLGENTWWGNLSTPYFAEGGALPVGLLGGRTTSHYDYAAGAYTGFREGQEGLLLGLYIDKDGHGVVLEGSYSGDFFPQDDGQGNNNQGLFLSTGDLRATWKASGFGPTDSYNFSAIDGAYSGQIQDGAGNAAGSVMSSPLGIFGSSYGFLSSNTYWLEWNGTPEPWGIFNLELGGIYQLSAGAGAPQNWQLRLGGTALRNLESNEYWIAETANGSWAETAGDKRIAADLAGRYMTPTTLGVLNGRVLGSYDSNNTPGNWEAIALGTFENTVPLQFVSDLANGNGALSALVGGATSLWTATTSPLTMMGAWDGSNGIWAAPLASHNFLDGTATTYDNGAYQGFSSLLLDGGQGISGDLIALYADPNGQTGYLKGTLTGAGYADLRLFTADGSMTRSAMDQAPQGIDAANFSSNVTESGQILLSMTGAPAAVGFLSEARNEASISGQGSWGIWQSLLEGDGAATAPGAWSWQTTAGMDATYWTNYDNVQWQTATSGMTGTVTGAKADWVAAATSVYGGEIKGLFDPATAGWKAISQGAAIETGRFLEMAAGNPAALLAMNIPAIQVGSATLSQGAGTINNLSNVAMTDVRFFATSTGSAPRIWATNNVAGNYAAAGPVPGGTVVPLSSGAGPNNITANFGITNWSNGNWGAQVTNGRTNGSAAVGGFGVQFQGGAAGKIGNGSFTGTGAGIVKVP